MSTRVVTFSAGGEGAASLTVDTSTLLAVELWGYDGRRDTLRLWFAGFPKDVCFAFLSEEAAIAAYSLVTEAMDDA